MDITTLAAWGEFLGGIAVVISLVYLASQIRQNSNLLRISATSTTAQLHMGQNEIIAQDAEVSRLFYEGMANPGSLSDADQQRFNTILAFQVQGHQQTFEFRNKGIASESAWQWTHHSLRWFSAQPGFRLHWHEQGSIHIPSFCDYVDNLVREAEAAE